MTKQSISIVELSETIVLDDVTDLFYRSLVLPFFERCDDEPKTELQKTLDEKLSVKLARQLNWTASLTSLDTVTHKFSHFLEEIQIGALTEDKLDKMLDDNYWLEHAFAEVKQSLGLQTDTRYYITQKDKKVKFDQVVAHVCWKYFFAQMSQPSREILCRLANLSKMFVQKAEEVAQEQGEAVEKEQLFELAFVNVYPALVLLRLFDRALQALKQEWLNTLPLENEAERRNVEAYQPSADILLAFLKFDEFVKPHVFDSLHVDSELQSNLIQGELTIEPLAQIFLMGRSRVIKDLMVEFQILTPHQLDKFQKQLGIEIDLAPINEFGHSYGRLLSHLFDIEPSVA